MYETRARQAFAKVLEDLAKDVRNGNTEAILLETYASLSLRDKILASVLRTLISLLFLDIRLYDKIGEEVRL